jgi:hypothetical protein
MQVHGLSLTKYGLRFGAQFVRCAKRGKRNLQGVFNTLRIFSTPVAELIFKVRKFSGKMVKRQSRQMHWVSQTHKQ